MKKEDAGVFSPRDVFTGKLENGLRYALWGNGSSDVVEIRLYLRAGSVYENAYPGSGISHFLEHLTAEGPTGLKSRRKVRELLEKFGNSFNAYTAKDHTCYHITTVEKYALEALSLLGEMVFLNRITRQGFRRERGVILREIEKSLQEPGSLLYTISSDTLYGVHPARFPVTGYENLFLNLTVEDLRRYSRMVYTPSNAILAIGGNIEPGLMAERIREYYNPYPRGGFSLPALPEEPRISGVKRMSARRDIKGYYMSISWLTVSAGDRDHYVLDLLSVVLSGYRGSRLNRIIRDERQLVNYIDAESSAPGYGRGEFSVISRFSDTGPDKVREAVIEEIQEVRENGVTEFELEKARKLLLASYLSGRTTVTGRTAGIGVSVLYTGDPYFSGRYIEKLSSVTPEMIKEAASRYLDTDNYALTLIEPEGSAIGSGVPGPAALSGGPKPVELPSRTPLIIEETPGTGIAEFAFFFKGGATYDRVFETPGLFRFYASMLSRGTRNLDRAALEDEFEKRGAEFYSGSGSNSFYLKGTAVSAESSDTLRLLCGMILEPSFRADEIEKEKKLTLEAISQQENDWQKESFLNFRKHIFPDTLPYSQSLLGTPESVKSINRELLEKVHGTFALPGNLAVAAVGDFSGTGVSGVLGEFFSSAASSCSLPDYPEEFITLDKDRVITCPTGKDIVGIVSGFPTVTLYDRKSLSALEVIDALVSGAGYPSGRLHNRMRDGRLVYFAQSLNLSYLKSGCFMIIAATSKEKKDRSLKVIDSVIKDLRAGRYTRAELQGAREQILINHRLSLQSPSSRAQGYALNQVLGFGYDYDSVYLKEIEAVTPEDAANSVKKFFGPRLTVLTLKGGSS